MKPRTAPTVMPSEPSLMLRLMKQLGWILASFLTVLLLSTTAQAQNIDKNLDRVDTFLGYTDKYAPGQLPVTQPEFQNYRVVLKNCLGSSDADDVILCVDAFLDTPAGKEVAEELPSWAPMVLDIYIDIRNDDFWGLARDVGMTAACIGAQVITGGVDVCGAIQALIDMAKDVYNTAVAIGKFFSDLGSAISDAAEAVYCYFSDCSGGGPPPQAVAYANFWFPRIPAGASLIKSSGDPQALDSFSFTQMNAQEALALKVQNPKVFNALAETRAAFIEAVKLQWDVQVVQEVLPNLGKVRQAWGLPDKAIAQAGSGFHTSKPSNGLITANWQMAEWRKKAVTNVAYFCRQAMFNAQAMSVHRWVKDGRAAKMGSSETGPTADTLCEPHVQLAQAGLEPAHRNATRKLLLDAGCKAPGSSYACETVEADASCHFSAEYFKSGFNCALDWRKAVAKLMASVGDCSAITGDQAYQCKTWPAQESCQDNFGSVKINAAAHCQVDKTKADAHLAQLQAAKLSTNAHPCAWQNGQIVCRRDVQHHTCQQLQQAPFYPSSQLHPLTCTLVRAPAYEQAVQQAQQLRAAMGSVALNAGSQTRSNGPAQNAPISAAQQATQGQVKWLQHVDPLLFLAEGGAVTAQGLAQFDQVAKAKRPGFTAFAPCKIDSTTDPDGVDVETLCTSGQLAANAKQMQEFAEKAKGMTAALAPGQVLPGGGGPVQIAGLIANNTTTPGGLQTSGGGAGLGAAVGVGGLGATGGAGGLGGVSMAPMTPMPQGAAPTQQPMSAPMPAPPASSVGRGVGVGGAGAPLVVGLVAAPVVSPMAPIIAPATTLPAPGATARPVVPDAATLRSLIAAGCQQVNAANAANAATAGAFTCNSDVAMTQCETARRESKVASCTRQR